MGLNADQIAALRKLGWQAFFERQVTIDEFQVHVVARVIAHHGGLIWFATLAGEISVPSSIIETDLPAAVGDWYLLNANDHRSVRQLERKTLLSRKAAGELVRPQLIAANVDTVFIVSSCNLDFNLSRLERYLALVLESGADPIVVLTKSDLCEDPAEYYRQNAEALLPGLIVETLDARDRTQTSRLNQWCGVGKTAALLGSSGVGKSTLANALAGLDLSTNEIREDDAKGRHTTTARSMHRLKSGGWLIDNPGMRELQLPACEQGVADLFDDIVQLSANCKFRNCSHRGDAGCALVDAVEQGRLEERRLQNYLKLHAEQARNSTSLAERREKERKTGQFYKSVIAEKRRRNRDG